VADDIVVQISAKLDQLQAGLNEAANLIRDSLGKSRREMKDTGESGSNMERMLKAALSGAVFLEFKQIAKDALHTVSEAFEETVGKAIKFGIETSKFATTMGMSTTQAAGLAAALEGAESSAQDYVQMAMMMERRVQSQEATLRALGMATRDANGQLLSGKALMDNAIQTMLQYKQGTDQNEFALEVFGRRAADVYNIMRASKPEQDDYIAMMRKAGVATGDTSKEAEELEHQLNLLNFAWDLAKLKIGQQMMPALKAVLEWFDKEEIVQDFGYALQFVGDIAVTLGAIFLEVSTTLYGLVTGLANIIGGLGKTIHDALTGNWSSLKGDVEGIWHDMEEKFAKTVERMKDIASGGQYLIDALAGSPSGEGESVFPKATGNRTFTLPNLNAGSEERKLQEQMIAAFEKMSLDRLKIEDDTNNHLLAMGQRTAEEFEQIAEHLENRKYAIQQSAIEARLSEDERAVEAARALGNQGLQQLAQAKLQRQKDMDDLQDLAINHEAALGRIRQQGEQRRAELSRQETQQEIQESDARLQQAMADVEELFRTNRISAEERATLERNLTATVRQEQLARLDGELQTLAKGTAVWQQVYKQRQKIAEDQAHALSKINNDLQTEQIEKWRQLSGSIRSSFHGALNGMILGTMGWRQALGQIIDSVIGSFLEMGEKILEDQIERWALTQILEKTNATVGATSQIAAAAAVAGANAYAATAAIPIVGPALAPAAGAAAYAGALSYEALAFAEQGMLLDRDRLVFAHRDEQILPAYLSKGLQALIKEGGKGSSSPQINLHGPFVTAWDTMTGAEALQRMIPQIAEQIGHYLRMNPSARGAY
jgi:hypothetical protein